MVCDGEDDCRDNGDENGCGKEKRFLLESIFLKCFPELVFLLSLLEIICDKQVSGLPTF